MGIAIGMIAGTSGLKGSARGRMTVLAAVIGFAVGFLAATLADGSIAAGALSGTVFAALACVVVSDVKLGASKRNGGSGALSALIVAAAIVVLLVTLLFEPMAIVFAAGLIWLAISRSRKGDRKHAGLRVLR